MRKSNITDLIANHVIPNIRPHETNLTNLGIINKLNKDELNIKNFGLLSLETNV